MNRKPIFDAAHNTAVAPNPAVTPRSEPAPTPPACAPPASGWTLGDAGSNLVKKWEGCAKRRADGRFDAYPDPGSADGKPWTIGWGSTGADVRKGLIWTQEQCDERFDREIARYVNEVARFIGAAPTTQNQFDALVSFHYNTGAVATSGLGKLHKQGRFTGARAEFAKWIYNDRKPMNGLRSRRADEAELYATP
ncbi:glycoside hydrolase family protein [Novosphingobium sp. Rr 2-17]|uniref:lysozyme n=1 Tax=Novosphingobium sp. Rr 2-17 TaxID=555793 RepID=UPI00026994B0|nr:lysozyme [Novosphingobium sp. Rr 2-17]EIZ81000.1 glycoside hydrolase family protein [Novosphingobium sp. Rr 2-17]